VFYALDSSLYDGDRLINGRIPTPLPEGFAVFEGTIPVESFDGWKIFVIDCCEKTKILFKKENEEEIRVAVIDCGKFDDALLELYNYIDQIFESESHRSSDSPESAGEYDERTLKSMGAARVQANRRKRIFAADERG
jgi:hypothetical protein